MRVSFVGDSFSEVLKFEALQDLKSGLASRNIDTCDEGHREETAPAATIVISSNSEENVQVTVEIRDAVTEKRVSRDIDLRTMPDNGRALAIAVAADELVWASWAEIAYKGAKRRASAPREVVAGVQRAVQPKATAATLPPVSHLRLGAQFAAEHFGAGLTHLGADALASVPLTNYVRLRVAAGARHGSTVNTPEGRITSIAASLAVDTPIELLQSADTNLGWALGARIAWFRFNGEAASGVSGRQLSGLALIARTGPAVAFRLAGPLWAGLNVRIGVPLRAIQASDTGSTVTGASGIEQSATLALEGEL